MATVLVSTLPDCFCCMCVYTVYTKSRIVNTLFCTLILTNLGDQMYTSISTSGAKISNCCIDSIVWLYHNLLQNSHCEPTYVWFPDVFQSNQCSVTSFRPMSFCLCVTSCWLIVVHCTFKCTTLNLAGCCQMALHLEVALIYTPTHNAWACPSLFGGTLPSDGSAFLWQGQSERGLAAVSAHSSHVRSLGSTLWPCVGFLFSQLHREWEGCIPSQVPCTGWSPS